MLARNSFSEYLMETIVKWCANSTQARAVAAPGCDADANATASHPGKATVKLQCNLHVSHPTEKGLSLCQRILYSLDCNSDARSLPIWLEALFVQRSALLVFQREW